MKQIHLLWFRKFFLAVIMLCLGFLGACTSQAELIKIQQANRLAKVIEPLTIQYPDLQNKPIVLLRQSLSPELLSSLEDGTIIIIISGVKVLKTISASQMLVYSTNPSNIFFISNINTSKVVPEALISFKAVILDKEHTYNYQFQQQQYKILTMKAMKLKASEIHTLIAMLHFREAYGSYTNYLKP